MNLLDQVTVQLTRVSCWCGVVFAVPEHVWDEIERKRSNGQSPSLHCPVNGHTMHWSAKDDLKRAQDAVVRERQAREQAEARANDLRRQRDTAVRQVNARKGVATRLKKRISSGRCTCCSRVFKDLRAHMQSKHPKWNPETAAEAIAAKVPA